VGLLSPQIVQIFTPSLTAILIVFLLAHVSTALLLNKLWRYREAFIGEKEKSESFRFASEILESISESFILIDRTLRLLYVNTAACAALRVERASAEGKLLAQALPEFASPIVTRAMEDAWKAQQPQQFEVQAEDDGRRYEIRCTPRKNDMSVYFGDVTDRHATEAKLRKSETQLRMAGQLIRMGAWECGFPNGTVIWSNQVAAIHERPPGFSPELAEAIAFYALESQARIMEVMEACARDGAPFDEELQIVTAHGRRGWVRALGQAIRDSDGAITVAQGAFQDINTRKLAEEETVCLAKRLETTLESITDAFFTVDLEWRFTYLNSAAESWLHRARAELIGHVIWEEFPEALVGSFQLFSINSIEYHVPQRLRFKSLVGHAT
jgi:PAS domain-containing protein